MLWMHSIVGRDDFYSNEHDIYYMTSLIINYKSSHLTTIDCANKLEKLKNAILIQVFNFWVRLYLVSREIYYSLKLAVTSFEVLLCPLLLMYWSTSRLIQKMKHFENSNLKCKIVRPKYIIPENVITPIRSEYQL